MPFLQRISTIIFICLTTIALAGPGDTIAIQTFEYDGFPVGNGWLAPREGHFDFSSIDGLNFEKIMIQYNLKCDNTQSPACGEWDYLSYIKVLNHTGKGLHPNFIVGGEGGFEPATFDYITQPAWQYEANLVDLIAYDDYNSVSTYTVGSGNEAQNAPFDGDALDGRAYYIYTASELEGAGLTAGEITGFQFDVNTLGNGIKNLKIRIKNSTNSALLTQPDDTGFTTVYDKNYTITNTGWQEIEFTNFFDWDGTSNLVIDLSYEASDGTLLNGSTLDWPCSLVSNDVDKYFNFNGPDAIELPIDNLAELDDEITISFWCYGNGEQPQNDSAFEGRDSMGNRIVNAHLPWSNNNIYWDAGNDTGYDRINKTVDNNTQTKGTWNHWAFTKGATTGVMKIYLNGQAWHSGTGLTRPLGAIAKFVIGRGLYGDDSFYDGKIDDFRVWKKRLTAATIAEWMNKDIDATHPNYEDLVANYTFNDTGFTTEDGVTNQPAILKGIPQRLNYNGQRIKGFVSNMTRPNIKFVKNEGNYTLTNQVVVDSTQMGQILLEKYVQNQPGEKPELDETLYVYPPYYHNFVYDDMGNAIDSSLVGAENTLTLEQIEYNTTTAGEEIINPIELGRFITPYGNGLSLNNDGWTWTFDVSDFKQFLHGNDVHLKAGNFQELLNMKFLFIEGTPPREVLDIQSLYSKNVNLSDFDNIIVDTTVQLLPEAEMFKVKSTVTGHGFGSGANCGEFCSNVHSLKVNGEAQYAWQILQECGENPLFPQGGTWMYDRAGWCPGMPGKEQNHEITDFINVGIDTEVAIDYDINYDPYGNYVTEIFLVSYGPPNFENDVSIEEIIAPNTFKLKGRFNPICASPVIKIKNTGSNLLTNCTIEYSILGEAPQTYVWNGFLEFLEEEIIELPPLSIEAFMSGNQKFSATVSLPNSAPDEYIYNNTRQSDFELAPVLNQQMIIWFKTNFLPGQNNYKVYDAMGNVVYSRSGFTSNALHRDTLNLPPGCYEFKAFDSGGDGMNNWPANSGDGYIRLKNLDGSTITDLENWFGQSISYRFINQADIVDTESLTPQAFSIYPNPSNGTFYLEFDSDIKDVYVQVFDITGKLLLGEKEYRNSTGFETMDFSSLENGMYLLNIRSGDHNITKKILINN